MLNNDERASLISIARSVLPNACAAYSGFRVGAALLTADGNVYTGVNVESSSYGGTICAERTALVKALSEGEREFVAIAVVSDSPDPLSPCGICRQLLYDYAPNLDVISEGGGIVVRWNMVELLPVAFTRTGK